MALSKLENLYRAVIVDHNTHPHHFGRLDQKTDTIELRNPTCGDVIQLDLEVQDNKIVDARFSGEGCAISIASASMMTDIVIGLPVSEAKALIDDFSRLVLGRKGEIEDISKLKEAQFLQGVSQFPARIKCATLSWKALEKALDDDKKAVYDIEELEGDK